MCKGLKRIISAFVIVVSMSLIACSSNAAGDKATNKVKVCLTTIDSSGVSNKLGIKIHNQILEELKQHNNIKMVNNTTEADVLYSVSFIPLSNLKKVINEDYMAYSTTYIDFRHKRQLLNNSCLWLNDWTNIIKPSTEAFIAFISKGPDSSSHK